MGVSDLGKGKVIEYEGELWVIEDYAHVKKAQGRPVAQCRLRHIKTGKVIPQNFFDSAPVKIVRLDERPMQYLYNSGNLYTFMDTETYDQYSLTEEQVADVKPYLKENTELSGLFYEGSFIRVDLPLTIELQVKQTDPGVRGDTVSNVMKPAVLETGLELKVPLFINAGDWVKVDTRTGQYVERVNR